MQTRTNEQVARIFDEAAEVFDARSNPYTMLRRAEALAAHVRGRSLELGGGTAAVTAALVDRSQATHSDIAVRMCRIAREKVGCPSICLDAEQIPFADASIDTAVSAEMIYYLRRPERFIAEAYRVLRSSGRLLLSTTNPMMTVVERGRTLLRRLGFSRMFFDDGSPKFPPPSAIVSMLERAGFVVESVRGIVPIPLACCDGLNRILERTPAHRLGLFIVIVARKA
ncbi:MAG: methyltransferase domain-containing protein [Phycisphaerales bacterium]|nr:methyltransferase domain-containing protein [Phycisphaerales bacterium]